MPFEDLFLADSEMWSPVVLFAIGCAGLVAVRMWRHSRTFAHAFEHAQLRRNVFVPFARYLTDGPQIPKRN
jgi:hypothetical protein